MKGKVTIDGREHSMEFCTWPRRFEAFVIPLAYQQWGAIRLPREGMTSEEWNSMEEFLQVIKPAFVKP